MFDELIVVAKELFSLYGLIGVLVVLVGVWVAKRSGLVIKGDHARLANLVLGAIVAGLSGDPAAEAALQGAITSLAAALIYELFKWINARIAASRPATDAA